MRENTKTLIFDMMTTSTGKDLCDSGDAYGRHWQRNQAKYKTVADIEKEPQVYFEQPEQWYTLKKDGNFLRRATSENELLVYVQKIQPQSWEHAQKYEGYTIEKDTLDSSDIDYTVNIFHYLTTVLNTDDVCDEFNALPCADWDSEYGNGISKVQEDWLKSHNLTIRNDWNSYNGDCNLSQTIQGANVHTDDDTADEYPTYILLQIHQGCDVRGGYTDAKLFKIDCDSGYFDVNPNVYGEIDGVQVDTGYNGYSLTDECGEIVPVTPTSKIELYLN